MLSDRHSTLFNRVFAFGLVVVCCLMMGMPGAQAAGGTNGLLGRMETMVKQMQASGEMTKEEAEEALLQVEELRIKVDERIRENGGWINPVHDKDLYNLIDSYNKPIYTRYQNSKAKANSDPRQLGTHPKDTKKLNENTVEAPSIPASKRGSY